MAIHQIKIDVRRKSVAAEDIVIIEDPATGRKWEWRDSEHPGLGDYLHSILIGWHPYAHKGWKFKPAGRGAGPIRKAIARLLKKNPNMKPRELWDALRDNPPRNQTFCENRAGKYIEGPKAGDGMSYKHFSGIAKEERDKRKER